MVKIKTNQKLKCNNCEDYFNTDNDHYFLIKRNKIELKKETLIYCSYWCLKKSLKENYK